jgi:hypothetical protein
MIDKSKQTPLTKVDIIVFGLVAILVVVLLFAGDVDEKASGQGFLGAVNDVVPVSLGALIAGWLSYLSSRESRRRLSLLLAALCGFFLALLLMRVLDAVIGSPRAFPSEGELVERQLSCEPVSAEVSERVGQCST